MDDRTASRPTIRAVRLATTRQAAVLDGSARRLYG